MFLKANLIIRDITEMDLRALRAQGIRGFIFDLDNTLVAPRSGTLEDHIAAWLAVLQAQDFKCLVLSNNKKADYCKTVEGVLNIPVISHAAKPRRSAFRQALEVLGLSAREVAMVGDRPLTDIWVGQRMGAYTILVDPLLKRSERIHIRILRRMERWFVR